MTDTWRPAAASALADWGLDPAALRLLVADASTRRYLRGRIEGGTSVVVMDCGSSLPPVAGGRDGFAFTRWHAFYERLGIRVPGLLDVAREAGLVLLEDLGDEMLQHRVERAGPAAAANLYARAVHWGRLLAEEGTGLHVPERDPDEDPLVPARLSVEMDLFLAHAARVPGPAEAGALPPLRRATAALDGATSPALRDARSLLHVLCADVHAGGPMVLCHRDYHARNLVPCTGPRGEDLAVIDFQDTRRGPRAYDVASLAWDPYVTLPEPLIERLVEGWRPADASASDWRREVALAAGQRLIKAAGSYAWLSRDRGRIEYARWLEPALARAHERLEGWPSRDELWRAMGACGALD